MQTPLDHSLENAALRVLPRLVRQEAFLRRVPLHAHEDLLQTVLLRVLEGKDLLRYDDKKGTLTNFLWKRVKWTTADFMRRYIAANGPLTPLADEEDAPQEQVAALCSTAQMPEALRAAAHRELAACNIERAAREALKDAPSMERTAVLAHDLNGHSLLTVAGVYGKNASNVCRARKRGLARIRRAVLSA